ncbi:MAG: hypothetical protein AB8B87_19265 [Granulosicoccus sp.]
MTIEKRGSEKLLSAENGLCSLTAEELSQVAGGALPKGIADLKDYFPHGMFPPELLTKLDPGLAVMPGKLAVNIKMPVGRNISNGF